MGIESLPFLGLRGGNPVAKSSQWVVAFLLVDDEAKEMPSGIFLQRHRLTATSSVRSALKVLQKKDLVYRTENGCMVYDRIFGEWPRRLA